MVKNDNGTIILNTTDCICLQTSINREWHMDFQGSNSSTLPLAYNSLRQLYFEWNEIPIDKSLQINLILETLFSNQDNAKA